VPVPVVPLGSSELPVSRLALGSWRTYERISREDGVRVMSAAREAGIRFLDVARYNDELGTAPIPTGWSEVVFGELFAASGWQRDQVVVAGKLWWEFWPRESPADELAGSLSRTGLDHVDLLYSEPPPPDLPVAEVVGLIASLIEAGLARSWGCLNWTPEQMEAAAALADSGDAPPPTATEPAVSLVRRESIDDPAFREVVSRRRIAVVASYTLAGGVLTGKYAGDPTAGRAAGTLDDERVRPALAAGEQLAALAAEVGEPPAALAMAYALTDPLVTSVLFGATRPDQVAAAVDAVALADRLDDDVLTRLRAIGA
jgi:aryl-alcohol dehydrogenase-like predicted oxidoreductase